MDTVLDLYQEQVDGSLTPVFTNIDENGKPVGIYLDIFNHIAEKENWQIEYVIDTFGSLLEKIESGEIDVLLNIAKTAEREKYIYFANENIFTSWAEIIVPLGSEIKSIPDLENKRIAVLKNSNLTIGKNGIIEIINQFKLNTEIVNSSANTFPNNRKLNDKGFVKSSKILIGKRSGIG